MPPPRMRFLASLKDLRISRKMPAKIPTTMHMWKNNRQGNGEGSAP